MNVIAAWPLCDPAGFQILQFFFLLLSVILFFFNFFQLSHSHVNNFTGTVYQSVLLSQKQHGRTFSMEESVQPNTSPAQWPGTLAEGQIKKYSVCDLKTNFGVTLIPLSRYCISVPPVELCGRGEPARLGRAAL